MEDYLVRRLRKLLDILGNETRCRILNLVSDQPRFISEISKELDVGQQAILRHLDELSNFGLLNSFEEKDTAERKRKGRKRKYYQISPDAQYQIFISIDKDDIIFDLRTPEIPEHFERLKEIEKRISDVHAEPFGLKKLEMYQSLIKQLETEIKSLNKARSHAIRLLQILKSEFE